MIANSTGEMLLNRKGEWGQNLPPKLTVEGSEDDRKRKPEGDDDEGGAGSSDKAGRQTEGEEARRDKQLEPPPQKKRKKKYDMVNSSLAENISIRRKVQIC